jgi:hypothetical protein
MEGLMIELSDLSRRNDELMTGKDADLVVIRDLDAQLKEYKRKYEQAKTELRSVKGVSTFINLIIFLGPNFHAFQQPHSYSFKLRSPRISFRCLLMVVSWTYTLQHSYRLRIVY